VSHVQSAFVRKVLGDVAALQLLLHLREVVPALPEREDFEVRPHFFFGEKNPGCFFFLFLVTNPGDLAADREPRLPSQRLPSGTEIGGSPWRTTVARLAWFDGVGGTERMGTGWGRIAGEWLTSCSGEVPEPSLGHRP